MYIGLRRYTVYQGYINLIFNVFDSENRIINRLVDMEWGSFVGLYPNVYIRQ